MLSFESDELWSRLKKESDVSKKRIAAVAYVSNDSILEFSDNDILIVDASDERIQSGATSAKVIAKAIKAGASVYSCDSLHGKLIVFDNLVYVGSANISKNSVNHLNEFGLFSDDPTIISECILTIQELAEQSIVIDQSFVKRILKIKVIPRSSGLKKKRTLRKQTISTWMIGVYEDATYPGQDENLVNSDHKRIRVKKGQSKDNFWIRERDGQIYRNAKIGDNLIILLRNKWNDVNPKRVHKFARIEKITIDGEVKTIHYSFFDEEIINWSSFKKILSYCSMVKRNCMISKSKAQQIFNLWPE